MPGARRARMNGFPSESGSWEIRFSSMTWPCDALRVSSSGDSARTVTVSSRPPISIVRSRPIRSLTRTSTLSLRVFLKPVNSAVTAYMPGWRKSSVNAPVSFVTAIVAWLVSFLVAVTVTPGSAPPELSFTVPLIDPRDSCASAGGAAAAANTVPSNRHIRTTRYRAAAMTRLHRCAGTSESPSRRRSAADLGGLLDWNSLSRRG